MTATLPYFAAAVEADAAGQPMPRFFRHDLGFGSAGDVAGLIAYLASEEAGDVTGQAIGVGGDRLQLWSHPEPVVTAYREGGWSYDALAAEFPSTVGAHLQSVGESLPPLPEELQRPTPA
jgi:3-oxoacyl-[acyl-carrier protein] reductase